MAYIDSEYIYKMEINTREKHELTVWCELFNCNKTELLKIIEQVGSNAGKVKSALIKRSTHAQ